MSQQSLQVLDLSSSGRNDGSVTRELSARLIASLQDQYDSVTVKHRDLAAGMPFVDERWIEANFTPENARNAEHREALAYSDTLINELKNADAVVIGVPIYNFTIAASLKAWIDMICRAQLTFRYAENGAEGLLEGKKAYLTVASGGAVVGGAADFATPYLRYVLAFIGITDVEVITA